MVSTVSSWPLWYPRKIVYVTLDIDEVNALIASMAMLEQIGVAALADPLIPSLGHGHHALPWNGSDELASGGICTGRNRGIAR